MLFPGRITPGTTDKEANLYSVDDIRAEYNRLDKLCGVDTSHVKIEISKRRVTLYGSCSFATVPCKRKTIQPIKITIADFILEEEETFWAVIRHEYAHAVTIIRTNKSHGHDEVWQSVCQEIGCPTDVYTASCQSGIAREKVRKNYELRCLDCGETRQFVRRTATIKCIIEGTGMVAHCCPHGTGTHFAVRNLKTGQEWYSNSIARKQEGA